jgi:hypothetical protein
VANLNTVVASADPVAADAYAVGLTPWYVKALTWKNVAHLVMAAEMGLGEGDTSKLNVIAKTI